MIKFHVVEETKEAVLYYVGMTFRWTLIADDYNTAGYPSNLQFIDSQMHWFIFINQLQNVFQGSNPILPLSIQSAVRLIVVFNNRN